MAKLQYEQPVTINGKEHSLPENRAVEDWTWNRVKLYSFIFACLAAVVGLLFLGYWLGGSGCYTCTQNKPVAAVVTPPASSTQTEATMAELAKDLSTIADMLAEEKATTQAVVASSPPPKTEKKQAPVTKQARPPDCRCPPEPAKAPTVDQNPPPALTPTTATVVDPTAGMTPAQHRQYKIWVERR